MFASSKKPYTAVTVHIDRLTSTVYEEDDVTGLDDLIEVIRIQETGPTEAARCLRKKLKYGLPHSQLRALTIIDALIANAGKGFQRNFVDEPLLQRLRMLPTQIETDGEVKQKCQTLYRGWGVAYKNTPGLMGLSQLHRELPKRQKPVTKSRLVAEDERRAQEDPFGEEEQEEPPSAPANHRRTSSSAYGTTATASPPSAAAVAASSSSPGSFPGTFDAMGSSKKKKKEKKPNKQERAMLVSLEKERPKINASIGLASSSASELLNSLKHVNREAGAVPSQNTEVMTKLHKARHTRRQILRYIAFDVVQTSDLIGPLLNSNDALIDAVTAFEVMEKGIDNDSDSDYEMYQARRRSNSAAQAGGHSRQSSQVEESMAGLRIEEAAPPKPPRPSMAQQKATMPPPMEADDEDDEDDDDNPFGDHAAIK